ncbi:MAG: DciA family protein [Pseudomonadota bacterium]
MSLDRDPPRSTPHRRRISVKGFGSTEAGEALAWANEHRGRAPRAGARPVADAVAKVVRPMAKRFGPGVSELSERWVEIVGAPLAAWSQPERYQSGAGGTALVVRAKGPAAALIEAQSAQILDRVAAYSGKPVRRLRIVQGALKGMTSPARARPQRIVKTTGQAPQSVEASPQARLEQTLERWRRDIVSSDSPPDKT